MGTQPSSSKRAHPQLTAHIFSGQMAAWIKMPLGMEVGVFVLDEDPAPPPNNGAEPPIFGRYMLRPNGCMDQDATWYGGSLGPGDFVLDGDLAPPPNFRPMFIAAKRLDGSRWQLAWR